MVVQKVREDFNCCETIVTSSRHFRTCCGLVAPDAGKTTIATRLAERYGLQLYVFDRWERNHIARMDPERQPALCAFVGMTMDQRWVLRTPDEMAAETVRSWTERFWMAIDDVLTMPREAHILAEGPGFFPECVQPLIASPHQAIWLVPTADFKRASAARRGKPLSRHETSDPAQATRNWLERDMLLAEHVRQQAQARGLALLEVDGSRSMDEMTRLIEGHFSPLLPKIDPTRY